MKVREENQDERRVGWLLGIGIALVPVVFAWFTLREGHSEQARYISFAWLGVAVIISLIK